MPDASVGHEGSTNDRRHSLRITLVSEAHWGPKGHGVEVAVTEITRALCRLGTDVRTNRRWIRSDVIHIHTLGPLAWISSLLPKPIVITAHVTPGSLIGSVVGAELLAPLVRRYMSAIYRRADVVIAPSARTAIEIAELGVESTKIEILSPGVPMPPPPSPTNIGREERTVISVGQLQPRKGVDLFVQVARQMPDLRFIWVGDAIFGILSKSAHRMRRIVATAPRNVEFTGRVAHDEVFALLKRADLFVSLSIHETFGVAAYEAALTRVPLVLIDGTALADSLGSCSRVTSSGTHEVVMAISDVLSGECDVAISDCYEIAAAASGDSSALDLNRLYDRLVREFDTS